MVATARESCITCTEGARTTGGGGNWFSQSTTSYHGGDAAQSGSIANNGQSWMQTTVSGPGIIRFYWKVSSQLGDYPSAGSGQALEFFIDGVRQARISGTTDWQGQSYTITGSGTHTLKWRYTKNGSGTGGSDCAWVDYVQSPSPTDWLTITYGYDSAGRRIEKAYDGQTVMKYLYARPEPAERDGSQIIADYDGNGSLLHKYIYGPGVDQPICMIDVEHGNAAYYYHFDGLGSVIALTNSSGSVANLYEYSVYGEVSASDPNHPNRFLFTGREFDADAGLYYYRARYYNPYIGRFLQTDPARDGMNAYRYCGNNPVKYTDPSGLFDPYDLPWNYGPKISISVAFYDGSDPGGPGCSNGAQMKEDADDFTYTKDGLTYWLYYDMGDKKKAKHPDQFIAETLNSLSFRGYKVTNVYFYDHCRTRDENGDFAIEFGDEVWGPVKLQAFARWINFRYPDALPSDCTLNFRCCYLASATNRNGLFKNLASWFNRNVTGCSGAVMDYPGIPTEYDPSFEAYSGPDYTFDGDLWMVTPGGKTTIIWQQMVPWPTDPTKLCKNPMPSPY